MFLLPNIILSVVGMAVLFHLKQIKIQLMSLTHLFQYWQTSGKKEEAKTGQNVEVKIILWGDPEELLEDQNEQFLSQVMKCEDIFAKYSSDLGKTDLLEHEIDTSNCKPMKQHPHWVPPYQQEVINQQLEVL